MDTDVDTPVRPLATAKAALAAARESLEDPAIRGCPWSGTGQCAGWLANARLLADPFPAERWRSNPERLTANLRWVADECRWLGCLPRAAAA